MNNLHVRVADWQKDNADLRRIREAVFIAEQSVPPELEWDDEDAQAIHFLALDDDYAIGTARLLPDGHIGRMAVLPHARTRGVGGALLRALLDEARCAGHTAVELSAQTHARAFYERHGFTPCAPFADYTDDPESAYFTLSLSDA